MRRREVLLSQELREELIQARDHHEKAFVRVKAAAILKAAEGIALKEIAQHRLLKPVQYDTVRRWIEQYEHEGLPGLLVQQGRGRKPAFFCKHLDAETAAFELQEVVHRSPRLYDLERGCWWLDGLRQTVEWLNPLSLPGTCQLLKRLHISYKRGRQHVHSPDLDYDKKMACVRRAQELAWQAAGEVVFLYSDEFTFFSRPRGARTYGLRGDKGAKGSVSSSKLRRIAACLDVATGAVIARQRDHFTVKEMYRFFYFVEQQYPDAKLISIALDNWPVHFHPYVCEHLERRHSRIRLLPLPTYAPWTNPVEKVWLKLCKDVLDQHTFGSDWQGLKQAITTWCQRQREGSEALLRFVGLLHD